MVVVICSLIFMSGHWIANWNPDRWFENMLNSFENIPNAFWFLVKLYVFRLWLHKLIALQIFPHVISTRPAFTSSKSTMETLEECVKSIKSNRKDTRTTSVTSLCCLYCQFQTDLTHSFFCFHCKLWISKYWLGWFFTMFPKCIF